jgi:hypothetical protein
MVRNFTCPHCRCQVSLRMRLYAVLRANKGSVAVSRSTMRIDVLTAPSPTPDRLRALFRVWPRDDGGRTRPVRARDLLEVVQRAEDLKDELPNTPKGLGRWMMIYMTAIDTPEGPMKPATELVKNGLREWWWTPAKV